MVGGAGCRSSAATSGIRSRPSSHPPIAKTEPGWAHVSDLVVIFGQQREWRDPIAFVALAIGALALIAFPFQMRRAHNPLVPLDMFKSRNFTVTNLSTFVIYGALYVAFYYMPLLSQGTLGYTAAAAGLAFVPGTIFMVLFSRRFG